MTTDTPIFESDSRDELEPGVREKNVELTADHKFLEAVLENITEGVVACDENGILKLFNRATREFHGLPEEPLPPEKWAEHYFLFRPDGVTPMPMAEVPLLRAFNGETVKDAELVIETQGTGRRRRIVASGQAFYDLNGKKLGAVAAMRDVTEQLAAEERFQHLFNSSSVAKFLLQDGNVLDCNNAAADLLGCANKAEVMKRHPAEFSPEFQPDGRPSGPTRRAMDQKVLETGFECFEWALRRADGSEVFVEVSLTAIKLEGKDAVISVCHDITRRKRSEQALDEAKRFAESVADHSSCAIYIRRLDDGTFTYMNRESMDFIGMDCRQSDRNGPQFNKNFIHPDDLPKFAAARESISTARDGQVIEYQARCRHVSGEWRHLLHRQVVFQRNADGTPSQIMGTAQDITALLKIQDELRVAKEAAEAATRAKTEFLANMSHEIRTPMTAILGYTQLLADPNKTAAERADFASVVRRNGEHLLSVLNDILDITKIEAGKMALELLEVNPEDILSELRTLLASSAVEKGLVFDIEQNGQLPELILTDPTRLKQVLLNLLSNAIKFTSTGSVRLTVSCESTGVSHRMQFDVADTGIGLTPQQQARLFNAFVQADTSMNRRFGGTGLGLVICKRLAGMLGGDLSVVSQPGAGSTFSLVLDIKAPTVKPSVAEVPSDSETVAPVDPRLLAAKILVAEDTPDTRRLVTLYLEHAGATVEAVSNGLLALDAVCAAAGSGIPFDIVLMDMQMPEMDGYTATTKLRELGFNQLPILAFTAHAMQEDRQRCLLAGCNDCILKPIDYDELIQTVQVHRDRSSRQPLAKAHGKLPDASDDNVTMQDLVEEYVAGLPGRVAEIADALAEQNLAQLSFKVHQLSGSGGSYGFPEISTQARQAESLIAKSQPITDIATAVEHLLELVRSVDGYDPTLKPTAAAERLP